jgi:hypothetical protein
MPFLQLPPDRPFASHDLHATLPPSHTYAQRQIANAAAVLSIFIILCYVTCAPSAPLFVFDVEEMCSAEANEYVTIS